MKYGLIIFSFLLMFTGNCQTKKVASKVSSPETKPSYNDSIGIEKNLPVYHVDSCLLNLFEAIVEGDKGSVYFGADKTFYSLNLENHESYISMDIWPMRWNKAAYFDYFAILNIHGMQFLFRGDYRNDSLYHKSGEELVKIKLQRPKKNRIDEIDKAINLLFLNPALRGKYLDCHGLTIYTEVYIEGKLPDFWMESVNKK